MIATVCKCLLRLLKLLQSESWHSLVIVKFPVKVWYWNVYCELGSCFSIPFPEYWERALRNLILVLIFETVMNATNHCHSSARILLMFHHHQQQEIGRRYSCGQEFILSSFRPDQTSRLAADTDTKLLLFGWDNFLSVFGESLSLAMERLHSTI